MKFNEEEIKKAIDYSEVEDKFFKSKEDEPSIEEIEATLYK